MAGADHGRNQAELRFRELYQAHFRPVQGYAVNRLGGADDVPDVVAEVFTIAWRRLADIPPPPGDRLWLYGTARRVIARRHRSAGRLRNLVGRLAAERYPAQPPAGAGDPVREQVLTALASIEGRSPGSPAARVLGAAQLCRGRPGARLLGERRGDPGAQGEGTDARAAGRGNRGRPARRRHQAEWSHRWILTRCSPRPPRPGTCPSTGRIPRPLSASTSRSPPSHRRQAGRPCVAAIPPRPHRRGHGRGGRRRGPGPGARIPGRTRAPWRPGRDNSSRPGRSCSCGTASCT